MQYFKQSDNDMHEIWITCTENDNIEKVWFSDVSTYLRCYSEKKLECGGQRSPIFTLSHREVKIWTESHMQYEPLEAQLGLLVLLF